jgi:hypothetical protein
MAHEKTSIAYPMSGEVEPFVASTAHEPKIILAGQINPKESAFDVPDFARGIAWNDPFYESDQEVIAAFDFSSNKIREISVGRELFARFVMTTSILLGWILSVANEDGWICWFYLCGPIAGSIAAIAEAKKEIYMLGRRHVAIARCGIYLDETDEPGFSSLAKRRVLKFDSIVSCRVHDTGCARPHYSVVIVTRNTDKPATADTSMLPKQISHTVTGLSNGQTFVDLVSAMMEHASLA